MTTDPTIDDKIRAVCAKLPELGWKPGMKCNGCFDRQYWTKTKTIEHHGNLVGTVDDHAEHDIPLPTLTPEFADKLMTALLTKPQMYDIDSYLNGRGVHICHINQIRGEGPNWREALLDAAYRLLGGKEHLND